MSFFDGLLDSIGGFAGILGTAVKYYNLDELNDIQGEIVDTKEDALRRRQGILDKAFKERRRAADISAARASMANARKRRLMLANMKQAVGGIRNTAATSGGTFSSSVANNVSAAVSDFSTSKSAFESAITQNNARIDALGNVDELKYAASGVVADVDGLMQRAQQARTRASAGSSVGGALGKGLSIGVGKGIAALFDWLFGDDDTGTSQLGAGAFGTDIGFANWSPGDPLGNFNVPIFGTGGFDGFSNIDMNWVTPGNDFGLGGVDIGFDNLAPPANAFENFDSAFGGGFDIPTGGVSIGGGGGIGGVGGLSFGNIDLGNFGGNFGIGGFGGF